MQMARLLSPHYTHRAASSSSSSSSSSASLLLITAHLVIGSFLWPCSAEELFHRRDHRDQGEYQRHQPIYTVQTYEDALNYLVKYGYLNCTLQKRARRALEPEEAPAESRPSLGSLDDLAHEGHLTKPTCTQGEIKEAFKAMQDKFGLTATGDFSAETQKTMSSSRCGNRDTEKGPSNQNMLPVTSGDHVKPHNVTAHKRVRRRALDVLWESVMADQARSQTKEVSSDAKGQKVPYRAGIDLPRLKEVSVGKEAAQQRRVQQYHELKKKYAEENEQKPSRQSWVERLLGRRISKLKGPKRLRRTKRTISTFNPDEIKGGGTTNTRFTQQEVCWRLLETGISHRIPPEDQQVFLELSFRRFGEVCPIIFRDCKNKPYKEVDILIAFGRDDHQNCNQPFDGTGGELAHSWYAQPGNVHFDDAEDYRSLQQSKEKAASSASDGISLLKVAVHEIGHVLGLLHTQKIDSIMYPIYNNNEDDFEISKDDRRAVQRLYGVCKGRFDVIMDWVRKTYTKSHIVPDYKYNSYFFRGDTYWLYENSEDRPRYGDPLEVAIQWKGLPSNLDGYAQVFEVEVLQFKITTYFFKGEYYYKYNDDEDKVYPGYPRRIADDFAAKPGWNESIPSNIDSVLFDPRDSLLYFFKGEWVWAYNPTLIGSGGCCEFKKRFVDLYPTESGSTLTGNIDTVYRSFYRRTVFIFVDEKVYENVNFGSSVPGSNLLRPQGNWYDTWYDICDPRPRDEL